MYSGKRYHSQYEVNLKNVNKMTLVTPKESKKQKYLQKLEVIGESKRQTEEFVQRCV